MDVRCHAPEESASGAGSFSMDIRRQLRRLTIVRNARRFMLRVIGVDPWLRIDAAVPTNFIGSEYGGWYVATDLLPAKPRVLSLGVGTDITFDQTLIANYSATVVACDPTPIARLTVQSSNLQPPIYEFQSVAVSDFDGSGVFEQLVLAGKPSSCYRLAKSTNDGKLTVSVRSIASVISEHFADRIDVVKMDIEGSEYEVIPALLSAGARPGQVLVEFHHRFQGRSPDDTRSVVAALRAAGYRLVRISDQGPECSFVHERLLRTA